jgi:hypothetical protein
MPLILRKISGHGTKARSNKETFIYNSSQQAAFKKNSLTLTEEAEVTERLERGDEYDSFQTTA